MKLPRSSSWRSKEKGAKKWYKRAKKKEKKLIISTRTSFIRSKYVSIYIACYIDGEIFQKLPLCAKLAPPLLSSGIINHQIRQNAFTRHVFNKKSTKINDFFWYFGYFGHFLFILKDMKVISVVYKISHFW